MRARSGMAQLWWLRARNSRVRDLVLFVSIAALILGLFNFIEPGRVLAEESTPRVRGASSSAPKQAKADVPDPKSPVPGRQSPKVTGKAGPRQDEAVPDSKPQTPPVEYPSTSPSQMTSSAITEVKQEPDPGAPRGFNQSESREKTEARTPQSTVFDNGDGTETVRIFAGEAYVRQADGTLVPRDLRLEAEGGKLRPRAASTEVSISTEVTDPLLVELPIADDVSVAFSIADAASSEGELVGDSGEVLYRDVRTDADVRLSAVVDGVKELLILRSVQAPTSWTFPLRLQGLTPRVNSEGDTVEFTDSAGQVRAIIPPGWMEDSKISPTTGEGAISRGVRYSLVESAGSWSLQVELDKAWLSSPDRVFPIQVDPTLRSNVDSDDTYVTSGYNANASFEDELKVGTSDGTRVSASFLNFQAAFSQIPRSYVLSASLNVVETWSLSCTASPVDLYVVGGAWTGSTLRTWPGPWLGKKLGTLNAAHGYNSSCPAARISFPVDADLMTQWTHGIQTFRGFSLRASSTNVQGWKKFASAQSPVAANIPYMDVTYSIYAAKYSIPTPTFNPPITNTQVGRIGVRLTNWGRWGWHPYGDYKLTYRVNDVHGNVVAQGARVDIPAYTDPLKSVNVSVPMGPFPPGSYTAIFDMVAPDGKYFGPNYGIPQGQMSFTVSNVAPAVVGNQPPSGASVTSIRPSLYIAGDDPDDAGWQMKYSFRICGGTPAAPTGCQQSGWIYSPTWVPPAGTLKFSNTYFWYAQVSDQVTPGPVVGPIYLSTVVPQPEITRHLAGVPADAEAAGVDPQTGNYASSVTDASVQVPGPPLAVTRTYNSLEPRRDTAFGPGWSSNIDTRLWTDEDGSNNVIATFGDGRQVRFGANGNGNYAPPRGMNLTLVYANSKYTLADASSRQWEFAIDGRLIRVLDVTSGLSQVYDYGTDSILDTITDQVSGRKLSLTWSSGRVTSVATDPPVAGAQPLKWNYTYSSGRLVSACTPLSTSSCTTYGHSNGSVYRSVVLDDNPSAFWTLGDEAGDPASNIAGRDPAALNGKYHGYVTYEPGAIAGSTDNGTKFPSTGGWVSTPNKVISISQSLAVEAWFKTTATGGVVFGQQNKEWPQVPERWTPLVYVGTDGKLRGQFWSDEAGANPITTAGTVNDGTWHHVVLTGSVNTQTLYLDGVAIGTRAGVINHLDMHTLFIGNGYTQNWTGGTTGYSPFNGVIDDVAVYQHGLGRSAIVVHNETGRNASNALTSVTLPGQRVFAGIEYNTATNRVSTLTDHHGRAWSLGPQSNADGNRRVTLTTDGRSDISYDYSIDEGGRITTRRDGWGDRVYGYNSEGFLSSVTNELGEVTSYTTDSRGNRLSTITCREATSCQTKHASYSYDPAAPLSPMNDKILRSTDARSSSSLDTPYQTSYGYDAAGRLFRITFPQPTGTAERPSEWRSYTAGTEAAVGGGTVPAGLLLTTTSRRGHVTTYAYTSKGDLASATSPTGLKTSYTHDALGRVATQTQTTVDGATSYGTTSFTYSPMSEIATITAPGVANPLTGVTHTARTAYSFNDSGQQTAVAVSDTTGGDPTRTTSYEYDTKGRVTKITDPAGGTETRTYDTAGRLATVTDANGLTKRYEYTERGQVQKVTAVGEGVDPTDPAATELELESAAFDRVGRIAESWTAAGQHSTFTYYTDGLPKATVVDQVTDADGAQIDAASTQYTYDPAGNPTRVQVGNRVVTTTYDMASLPVTETLDPTGLARAATYKYDAAENVVAVSQTGAGSPNRTEVTEATYDPNGGVLTNTVVNGAQRLTTTTTRDVRGLPISVQDPNGSTTEFAYDMSGALQKVTAPAVPVWLNGVQTTNVRPTTMTGRNTFGDVTGEQNANGNVVTYQVNGTGRVTATTLPSYTPPGGQPSTATTTAQYNAAGLPIEMVDPLGRKTEYDYDKYGRVVQQRDPAIGTSEPGLSSFTYDRAGRRLSATDPTGARTQWTYDELSRPITETTVERKPSPTVYFTSSIYYDLDGNAKRTVSPTGAATAAVYNAAGEPTGVTDATNRTVQFGYDLVGRKTSEISPSGLTTSTTFDLAGRATETKQIKNGTTLRTAKAEYDSVGNLTASIAASNKKTAYTYDALGRRTAVISRAGYSDPITVSLGYDKAGNLTRQTDGRGRATDFTYNSWELLNSVVEPSTAAHPNVADRTWTTIYDAAANPVEERLPGGVVLARTFDELGRLTSETGTGAEAATRPRAMAYDRAGRLTSASTVGGNLTFSYNDRGQLIGSIDPEGVSSFTYDGDGNLVQRADPSGSATFGYDPAGRISTAAEPLTGKTFNYTYNNDGLTESINYGGALRAYTYDELGRLKTDTTKTSTGTVTASIAYGYDVDDNITSKTTSGLNGSGSNTYGYGRADRLTSWTAPNGTITNYTYDDAGNLLRVANGGVDKIYHYDERNRLRTYETPDGTILTSYEYSPRGTLRKQTSGTEVTESTFDAFERLTQQALPGTTITYQYDDLDRLAQRNGVRHRYSGQANEPVSDGTSILSRGPAGELLAERTGTAARVLLTDQHDDVIAAINAGTAAVEGSTAFDPFGVNLGTSGTTPNIGYQSGWTDPQTGQVNAAARWYRPGTSTFLSRDTLTITPSSTTDEAHRYAYGVNNPLKYNDPTGHCPQCLVLVPAGGLLAYAAIGAYKSNPAATKDALDSAMDAVRFNAEYEQWKRKKAWETARNIGRWAMDQFADDSDNDDSSDNDSSDNDNPLPGRPDGKPWPQGNPPPGNQPGPAPQSGSDPGQNPGSSWEPPPPPSQDELNRAQYMYNKNTPIARPALMPSSIRPRVVPMLNGRISGGNTGGITNNATRISMSPDGGASTNPNAPGGSLETSPLREDERDCLAGQSGSYITYGALDTLNRSTSGTACYSGGYIPKGSRPKADPVGYAPNRGLARGHLIAKSLGGDGIQGNLAAIYQTDTNSRKMYHEYETKVRQEITAGNRVYYRVIPVYRGSELQPTSISITISSSSGYYYSRQILNRRWDSVRGTWESPFA